MTTTAPTGAQALALIDQAVDLLDNSDDDPRLSILMAVSRMWAHTAPSDDWTSILSDEGDPRWNAAAFLLKHDESMPCERPLRYTAARLLAQISDQAEDLIGALNEKGPNLAKEAGELRSAMDRLGQIVNAITAVHLLDEATA
ncbi:MAG: hypothetical protein M3Q31_05280 [Actinomycetota bacterium]|nr:hypothetical protein [Actinomycetota bacterium]